MLFQYLGCTCSSSIAGQHSKNLILFHPSPCFCMKMKTRCKHIRRFEVISQAVLTQASASRPQNSSLSHLSPHFFGADSSLLGSTKPHILNSKSPFRTYGLDRCVSEHAAPERGGLSFTCCSFSAAEPGCSDTILEGYGSQTWWTGPGTAAQLDMNTGHLELYVQQHLVTVEISSVLTGFD